MKTTLKKYALPILLLLGSCDFDKNLADPNKVTLANANPDYIMNGVQIIFSDFYTKVNNETSRLVRQESMTRGYTYQTALKPQYVDGIWALAYGGASTGITLNGGESLNNEGGILVNTNNLKKLARKSNLTTHIGVAQALEAYTYLALVDLFGDVPQSTALKGEAGDYNPVADSGDKVYAHAIALLDSARIELAKPTTPSTELSRDNFYNGDKVKWAAFVNSIQLKAWLNISAIPARAVEANAKIDALLKLNLIDTPAENFTYKYGTATVPSSRHPLYNQYYTLVGGQAIGYLCNYFLKELYDGNGEKNVQDPRWRYYFYRQAGSLAQISRDDSKAFGCTIAAIPAHYSANSYVYCSFDPGFFGRDHGDASGAPPDGKGITAAGVYPAGGQLDSNPIANTTYSVQSKRGNGADGAGIWPVYMYFFTDFVKAEYYIRKGNISEAKTSLTAGIQNSITAVTAFATATKQTLPPALRPSVSAYTTVVGGLFDGATNKLDVVGREFWIATWGNGLEAYNNYRRTSAPRNPQPVLQTGEGPFLRSFVYPAVYANLNLSAVQKENGSIKVFWDKNTDNLK